MPDFNEPQFQNPLMGKVFDSNPQARTASRSRCFERGYHLGPNADGVCADCAGRTGLPFRTEAEMPQSRPVYAERPPVVAHNEHADYAELMAERGLTPEEHRAAQAKRAAVIAGAEVEMPQLDKEQATKVGEAYLRAVKTPDNVKKWCAELGIPLVENGGVYLHLEERLKASEAQVARLKDELVVARTVVPDPVVPNAAPNAAPTPVHADHEGGL